MYDDEPVNAMGLSKIYAKFFVEDFARNIMNHLSGSYPLVNSELKAFIDKKAGEMFNPTSSAILNNPNVVNRFIYECAEYAVNNNIPDKTSYTAWADVSSRPSIHHEELQTLIYSSAMTYRSTVDVTLLGVIAKDASTTSEAIRQAAAARSANVETGGTLSVFNWGILNDGTWLNGALLLAFDIASVFRPGEKVIAYYTTTCFDFADNRARMPMLDSDQIMTASAQIDMLVSHIENPELVGYLQTVTQNELNTILFNAGSLHNLVSSSQVGLRDIPHLVTAIRNLSALVRLVNELINTARMLDESLVSEFVITRLHTVLEVATLILVGYEALRETKFAETLILYVEADASANDPMVNVVVNGDLLNGYHSAGGEDGDLIRFGNYLDPRKGTPANNTGYSVSYVQARRNDVVSQIIAEDADRLQRLRNNDAAMIQAAATSIINDVVRSYMEASMISTIPIPVYQQINALVRQITNPETEIDLDQELLKILASLTNDSFVVATADRLSGYLSSDNEYHTQNASALTIVETAISDAVDYITAEPSTA